MDDISNHDILHALVDLGWKRKHLAIEAGLSPNAVNDALNSPRRTDPRRKQTVAKMIAAIERAGHRFKKRGAA